MAGVHRKGSRAKTRICEFHINTSMSTTYPLLNSCAFSQCITDLHRSRGINSSRDLPDNVLTFARRHPLMANQVHPIGMRPLMFKRNVNYVKIVVHKEPALDGKIYTILFLGTGEIWSQFSMKKSQHATCLQVSQCFFFFADNGWLHRAVDIDGEMHIIEELQLFNTPQPIESMVISSVQVCKLIY